MDNTTQTLDYWINLAKQIANDSHKNQFRRDGVTPYIIHVDGVAQQVEPRLKPIAYLHDVVEDTKTTLQDLINAGFPSYITDAVNLLTHRSSDPDIIYWKGILTNPDAAEVKVVDINYNLNDNPSQNQINKYNRALEIFAQAGYSV